MRTVIDHYIYEGLRGPKNKATEKQSWELLDLDDSKKLLRLCLNSVHSLCESGRDKKPKAQTVKISETIKNLVSEVYPIDELSLKAFMDGRRSLDISLTDTQEIFKFLSKHYLYKNAFSVGLEVFENDANSNIKDFRAYFPTKEDEKNELVALKRQKDANKLTETTLRQAREILSPIFAWSANDDKDKDKKRLVAYPDFTRQINSYLESIEGLQRYRFKDSMHNTIKKLCFETRSIDEPLAKAVIIVGTNIRNELVDEGKLDPAYKLPEPF